jgi:hypothetical protein
MKLFRAACCTILLGALTIVPIGTKHEPQSQAGRLIVDVQSSSPEMKERFVDLWEYQGWKRTLELINRAERKPIPSTRD